MCSFSLLFAGDWMEIDAFDGEHRPDWANLSHPYTILTITLTKAGKGNEMK